MKLSLWCLGISDRGYIVTIANVSLIFDLCHRIRTCSSKTRQLHQVKKDSSNWFGLHKQRKPLLPIIRFDRTRGWGYSTKFYTGRIWDVPSGVNFCGSCILMLLGICCIYFSNTFFIMLLSVPGFLLLPELSVAFIPHILSMISIWRSLYFDSFLVGWSYQKGGRFYPVCSWLQCLVCWPLSHDLSVKVYIGISHKIVILFLLLFVFIFISLQVFRRRYRDTQRRFTLKYVKNAFEAT